MEDEQEEESIGQKASKSKISVKIRTLGSRPSRFGNSPDRRSDSGITYDFTLMDELFGILDLQQGVEPISCGYFNKIALALLNKVKPRMLQYLLLHR